MTIPLIPITINNKNFQVRATSSVLQACEEAGIDIPRFCYHEKLSVAGNCRMCLVEVEKSPKPVVSCAMPVSKGMVVYTNTPLVKKAREAVLEFLLINHPLDCPICDQGGECDLQDETLNYGSDRGRYFEFKRSVEDKECGPIIKTIMTRCIHCTRCVRFSSEIAGQEVMGAFGRGEDTEIGTYVQSFIKTELSGNLVDLCPVGALTSKPYAYIARNWELQKQDSIDFFDGITADISVQTRKLTSPVFENGQATLQTKDEILRILPRFNGLPVDNWISDKTRYAFDGLKKQRITKPFKIDSGREIKSMNWANVCYELSERFSIEWYSNILKNDSLKKEENTFGVVAEDLCDVESLYLLNFFIKSLGSADIQNGNVLNSLNIGTPVLYGLNRELQSFENVGALILIGTNPRYEASILNTLLRKQQQNKALPYALFNATNSLRIKHTHIGNSIKSLVAFAANKLTTAKNFYNFQNTSLILGADSLKSVNGSVLQNIFRFLNKKFYTQTKNKNTGSILHSNITSLLFANMGIKPGVRSIFYNNTISDKKIHTLFSIQPYEFSAKKWLSTQKYTHLIALGTHKPSNLNVDRFLPLKSFYEKDGYIFNAENRLRKFYKVVSSPKETRSLDAILSILFEIYFWDQDTILKKFWMINDEYNFAAQTEQVFANFYLNYLNITETNNSIVYTPFYPNLVNFYMTNSISANSSVMGECSLFLNKKTNFNLDY